MYQVVIGLEVHAQLATQTKIWCPCEVNSKALENTRTCEICLGHPGSLPTINEKVVEYAARLSLATQSSINHESYFDRKSYFYPDLPKGYQITQLHYPFSQDGFVEIQTEELGSKKVRLERIQIEEDTGKSTHAESSSLLNFNRCGTPLLEIVSRPDLTSEEDSIAYLKKLLAILVYLDISHGNLQDGNFRCDVNLSLKKPDDKILGTRREIKNLNSFRNVGKAIRLEIENQKKLLDSGEKVVQETLKFDIETQQLKRMRDKSDAHDYRYFPDPDLLVLKISPEFILQQKKHLPELPDAKRERFRATYKLTSYDADVLTADKELADYFEKVALAYKGEAKQAANWVIGEFLRRLKEYNSEVKSSNVSASDLAELLNYVHSGEISGKMAKDIFEEMYDKRVKASQCIEKLGLKQISSEDEIRAIIKKVFEENAAELIRLKNGEKKLLGFFVGQVMAETKGNANPKVVNKILREII